LVSTFIVIQYLQSKKINEETKNKFDELKKELDKYVKLTMNDLKQEINKNTPQEVINWFKEGGESFIFKNTRLFSEEVLMLSPEARDLTLSRLRRMSRDISDLFQKNLNEDTGKSLFTILGNTIEDWHTLSQLFSPDEKQIAIGLGTFIVRPIPERYKTNSEILPLILKAFKSIEDKNISESDKK
jgi:hypothetical protein